MFDPEVSFSGAEEVAPSGAYWLGMCFERKGAIDCEAWRPKAFALRLFSMVGGLWMGWREGCPFS